jgi:hypothetical protein
MAGPLDIDDDMQRVLRKGEAAAKDGRAFQRLLQLAETRDSGQVRRVALFIAATYNEEAFPFDLVELRAVDEAIGDDMLLCLDALRWGHSDLHSLVPDGDQRRIWVGKGGDRAVGPEVARGAVTAGHLGD